jgi:Domain of unknown function (DUF1905)
MAAFIGGRVWKTPVFSDFKSCPYLLAIKAVIRAQVKIVVGDAVTMHLGIDIS